MQPEVPERSPRRSGHMGWLIWLSAVALLLTSAALVVQSVYGFEHSYVAAVYLWLVTPLGGGPALLVALTIAVSHLARRKEWWTLTLVTILPVALGAYAVCLSHLWSGTWEY